MAQRDWCPTGRHGADGRATGWHSAGAFATRACGPVVADDEHVARLTAGRPGSRHDDRRAHLPGHAAALEGEAAPATATWKSIFNGQTMGGQDDRSRRAWALRHTNERSELKRLFAQELRDAGVLQCDMRGPYAGGCKSVQDLTALRCLPGCQPQPAHADVSLSVLRYTL